VLKAGIAYDFSPSLTLRAGYSHAGEPIPADQTFFNILAPATVQNHVSFGGTWHTAHGEVSAFYARALRTTVNGFNSIPASFGGGNADIHLDENLLGLAYAWRL
jgi:long-chain fatty acid transport protein